MIPFLSGVEAVLYDVPHFFLQVHAVIRSSRSADSGYTYSYMYSCVYSYIYIYINRDTTTANMYGAGCLDGTIRFCLLGGAISLLCRFAVSPTIRKVYVFILSLEHCCWSSSGVGIPRRSQSS